MSDIEEVSEVGEELVTRAAAIDIAKASAVVWSPTCSGSRAG
jgi:hypothetical protein